MVYSKPFIKIVGILLLIVRFAKSSDQTIQIIRKNKPISMFLIILVMFHRDVSKTIETSKMMVFVILFCGIQPSTNVTKNSVLGFAGALDPPLELYNVFSAFRMLSFDL